MTTAGRSVSEDIRIGVLGAARITRDALLRPAAVLAGVKVVAIASRDRQRAATYARRHGINKVHSTYDDLVHDDTLDAIYVPLPAALHGQWTMAAIEAGKHVLCEKPFTANAEEAAAVAEAASRSQLIVMEAHHTRYHPLIQRLQTLITSEELGAIKEASASFCIPLPPGKDIRWDLGLGGGALMDVGCYPLRLLNDVLGSVPTVLTATAKQRGGVDSVMHAKLQYGDGIQASLTASMWSKKLFSSSFEVIGTHGHLKVRSPYHPQSRGRVWITSKSGRIVHTPERTSSYRYQLLAFRDAIRSGGPVPTDPQAALSTMLAIDSIYRAAGMQPRKPRS